MGLFYSKLEKYLNIGVPQDDEQENVSDITPEQIIPPALSDIQDLYQMAKTGNVLRVEKMAQSLENKNKDFQVFSKKIQEMAKGFKINELKAFLEQFLS